MSSSSLFIYLCFSHFVYIIFLMLLLSILIVLFAGPQLPLQSLISIKLSKLNRLHAIKTIKMQYRSTLRYALKGANVLSFMNKAGKFSRKSTYSRYLNTWRNSRTARFRVSFQ